VRVHPLPYAHVPHTEPGLKRTQRSIIAFWFPLAATWLMMAIEGPFLAAVIARLADAKFNLAAYGVAYAVALLVESPVIMLMSASTALAEDRERFARLRIFSFGLSAGTTVAMLLILVPAVFDFVSIDLIALPADVARLVYGGLWLLLPWPGAIGVRRFYQGLLIRDDRTKLVATGTVLRLGSMAGTAVVLFLIGGVPGAYVAAAALSAGVSVEAVASALMARPSVRKVLGTGPDPASEALSYGAIARFYYPLALTSLIGLTVQPMLTFFMGRAPAPLESLAVFPVVTALSFIFRAMGLSYQEVAITLMGKRFEHLPELWRFAVLLGLASSAGLGLVALTPLARFWFEDLSALTPDLARFALIPTMILVPIPFFSVMLSFQRAILVIGQGTRPITWATVIEVGTIAVGFPLLGWQLGVVGATAAALAFVVGRIGDNLFLIRPCLQILRARRTPGTP
jgi:hypothetical protein